VRNFSLPSPQVRIQIPVSVAYGTDINLVKSVLGRIAADAQAEKREIIAQTPAPTVYLTKMDKSTMTFEVTVYANEFVHNTVIRDYLNIRIIETLIKENIHMA